MNGLAQGLSALAFWGFVAAVVVAGIWYGLRERQAQYETLSRMIADRTGAGHERGVDRQRVSRREQATKLRRIRGLFGLR